MSIHQKIKELRKKNKWSQAELGEMVGVHGGHISRLENGVFQPSLDLLKKLSEVFQVSADYLISDNDTLKEVKIEDSAFAERIKLLNSLEGKDKEAIMHIIDSILTKRKMINLLSNDLTAEQKKSVPAA